MIKKIFKKFFEDNSIMRAASLSYFFILSIIPITSLTLFIFNTIFRMFYQNSGKTGAIKRFIVDELSVMVPVIPQSWIQENIIYSYGNANSLTYINLLTIPIVSGLLFRNLDTTYCQIFNHSQKPFLLHNIFHMIMPIFFAVFLFVTGLIWSVIAHPLTYILTIVNTSSYFENLEIPFYGTFIISQLDVLSGISLIFFHIMLTNIFVRHKLNKYTIVLSALIFTLLWYGTKMLFQAYIDHIASVNIVYGSISSIVIVLMWIFYTSLLLIFTIEILYFLNEKIILKANINKEN